MSKPKLEVGQELEIKGSKFVVMHVSTNDNPDMPVTHAYELWDAKEAEEHNKKIEAELEKRRTEGEGSKYA